MNMICWISIFDYRTHALGASESWTQAVPASLPALMVDTTTRNIVSLVVFNGAL